MNAGSGGAAAGPDLCARFDLLDERVVALVARATGNSPAAAHAALARERDDPGAALRTALARRGLSAYAWADGLAALYAEDAALVYDSLAWNATWVKRALRARVLACLPEPPARVLCHGDGLGIDALALARRGYQPVWADASGPCRGFALSLFRSEGRSLEAVAGPADLPPDSCDAVVSLDVLEHCPDPGAEAALLAGRLKPGGLLIVNAPFCLVGPRHPTHLDANRRFSGSWGLYLAAGLSPVAGGLLWDPLVLRRDGVGARARASARLWPARIGSPVLATARWSAAPFAACEAAYRIAASGLRRALAC